MLRNKLQRNSPSEGATSEQQPSNCLPANIHTSGLFETPLWQYFYNLECRLNTELKLLQPPNNITHVYNPVEYAADLHCAYLRRYLNGGQKTLMFVGMNPGPNGMNQTGVPFGNVNTVCQEMQLSGVVHQPPVVHEKRPINGLKCTLDEPSGKRIWTLFKNLAGGSLTTFAQKCFVHNFCPLAFFDAHGGNITPSELRGDYKKQLRDKCLAVLDEQIELVQAQIIVAVGEYVYTCLKSSRHWNTLKILKLAHPSPRALNNQNWPLKAEEMLSENNLLMYIRNTI